VDLSRHCPPTDSAFSVGAVVVGADGALLAEGYSRDVGPRIHAEESALARLAVRRPAPDLAGATIYSSLEPCSDRLSGSRTCTQMILSAGLRRVVYALLEPPVFVDCQGVELLRAAGVEVIEMTELAAQVREINARVLTPGYIDDRC
jgi:diaminohydroxyphosphoribosylaminopyrimidine deaminase/5-amino-6-(5-phosphoribosylamino)uracil reductase